MPPMLGSLGAASKIALNSPSAGIVTLGLKLYLDAGNNNSYPGSGTTWTDLSGLGNNGTLNGPVYSNTNGGVLDFDGTNDYISSANSVSTDLTGSITSEVWFKLDALASDYVRVFGKGNPSLGTRTFGLFYLTTVGNQFLFQRYKEFGYLNVSYDTTVSTGVWYQLVGTSDVDTGTHRLYLNGVAQAATGPETGSYISSTDGYTIGGDAYHQYHNGPIALVRLYNRALTESEVEQNFNFSRDRFGI